MLLIYSLDHLFCAHRVRHSLHCNFLFVPCILFVRCVFFSLCLLQSISPRFVVRTLTFSVYFFFQLSHSHCLPPPSFSLSFSWCCDVERNMLAIFGIMSCGKVEEQKDHLAIKETVFLILLRTEIQKKKKHITKT